MKSRFTGSEKSIVVIYKNSPTSTYAESFILKEGEWIKEPLPAVIQKRDKFIYKSNSEKWTYISTEDIP